MQTFGKDFEQPLKQGKMNAVYLILIALGFSAGILASALNPDDKEAHKICTKDIEANSTENDMLLNPETHSGVIYFVIE